MEKTKQLFSKRFIYDFFIGNQISPSEDCTLLLVKSTEGVPSADPTPYQQQTAIGRSCSLRAHATGGPGGQGGHGHPTFLLNNENDLAYLNDTSLGTP